MLVTFTYKYLTTKHHFEKNTSRKRGMSLEHVEVRFLSINTGPVIGN
jgi:hypothetical protein